ncbi:MULTISPECIES: alpha/beta family hydrolase [unclassified Microbacterium]|uniref:alpha/beta hydrolase family protein n=1 Tax=unclassified Microbacterium TaxID=2609290 RepID=UPI00214BBB29|nr:MULTISPECIES: alpha/beta family hydrolase [unclassified Microbacterium]MCR2784464.1 dienelactone hydrolase family protein [Microbacterium sp. zg.B96]WIM14724.1 dienelactone hydrolase family protein [Microbacterium sp. zg-B96]
MTEGFTVALPTGEVTVSAAFETPADPWAAMAIAHGAGAGYSHPFLVGFARGMRAAGVATLRFNFPYVEAGRRMPGPAAHAVATWRAADAALRAQAPGVPVWAAGKSYGGRMASMAAAEGEIAPAGLVYLGYPLHPPGQPEKLRVAHLPDVAPPQLFVEGTNDPFVDPHAELDDAVASCRDAAVHWVDGGNHSFEVKGRKRPADEVGEGLADVVVAWLRARSAAAEMRRSAGMRMPEY